MLKLGTIVNYRKSKSKKISGVVVDIVEATDYFHGCIEVWLRGQKNYGDNNCEHFTADNYQDFLEVIKEPELDKENGIGTLLDTAYGKGMIVNNKEKISVFILNQDYEDLKNVKNYNSETNCLELEL